MMGKAVQDAINEQITYELYSGYTYLAMSAYFEEQSLAGFAKWMRLQAQEELKHAMRLFDHVAERGGHITLHAVDAPPSNFESPLDVFEKALAHEQHVTQRIHRLYELASKEKDYPAQVMLQWFVEEQVEEEQSVGRVVDALKRIGDDGGALLALDRELGGRSSSD
ncbi:MAG TPA: ferritin [Longimicrobiales bacterium]